MTDIRTAYCVETDAIEPADFAVKKRDAWGYEHHYFCLSQDCAHPLFPAHWHDTGDAWFRSKKITATEHHHITCLHSVGSSITIESSRGPRTPPANLLVVPNVLGQPEKIRIQEWPKGQMLDRKDIIARASRARLIRIVAPLEQITDAWREIRNERRDHPLEINGTAKNFASGFSWIWSVPRPWKDQDWANFIVHAYCKVNPGKVTGVWFLNALGAKGVPAPERVSLMVRRADVVKQADKQYIPDLLNAAAQDRKGVHLFWQGAAPTLTEHGYVLKSPNRPIAQCYALKTIDSSPTWSGSA